MSSKSRLGSFLFLLVLFLLPVYFFASKSILILNSYNPGFSWSDSELEGLKTVLDNVEDLEFYVEYMDTKRFGDEESLIFFREYLEKKFVGFNFDIILTLDNNAFDFVLDNYETLFKPTPIIYGGINYYQDYDLDHLNFASGVLEKHDIYETLELALKLQPSTENIYIVVDNYTKTGMLFKNELDNEIIPNYPNINFIFLTESLEQIRENLLNPLDNSLVLLLSYSRDEHGNFYDYNEIGEYMNQFKNIPIYTTASVYMNYDVLGGKITSAFDQGKIMGEIALKVLQGNDISGLPRVYFPKNEYVFNFLELERLGITAHQLPPDSIIINQPLSFHERNPIIFWIMIILTPTFIGFFYLITEDNRKLKVIIEDLNKTKEELQSFNEEIEASNEQLVSYNEELVAQNEEIENNYKEIEKMNNKIRNLVSILSELGKSNEKIDDFFQKFLETMILEIPESDYGSVSIIEKEEWRFLTAVGHDINGLKSLSLKKDYVFFSEEVTVVDNIISENSKRWPESVGIMINKYAKPTKSTMLKAIKIDDDIYLNISLDIRKGSGEKFSQQSFKFFDSLLNLAKLFLVNKLRTTEIQNAYNSFANKLSMLAESHDEDSKMHIYRVSDLSAFFAEKLQLGKEVIEKIRSFSPLHDVGKLFISPLILNKKNELTAEEWEEVRKHPLLADNLLEGKYFETARKIAIYHHERFDGSGYPFGLRNGFIPIEAQIVGIVDVYDALRSKRSYKEPYTHRQAVEIILNGDNRTKPEHFNPKLLEIIKMYDKEMEELYKKYEG